MNGQDTPALPNVSSSSFSAGTGAIVATASSLVGQDLAAATTLAKLESPISSFQRYAMVVARILVSIIFMMTALNVIGQSFAAHELTANGVPANFVPVLIIAARALQLVAGLGLILGIYPRISALALLLFLIPATLIGHAFWLASGTSLYTVQLINFFKNVSMAGGLIFIIAAANQPVLLPRPTRADSNQLLDEQLCCH
jgi:putative oxidoreductase